MLLHYYKVLFSIFFKDKIYNFIKLKQKQSLKTKAYKKRSEKLKEILHVIYYLSNSE